METIRTCPQCQQPLSADAPDGLCPQCLMKAATGPLPTTAGVGLPGDIIDIGDPAEVAKKLPQFEILEMLGRGGMGVVYKARQLQLDRLVALKILPPVDALSPDFVARFTREARALAKLNHPNIVNVHDFGETGGLYYIVMEYVEGANLRQLFEARKLSPAEALAIIPKICDALEYAHEEGLVHRDIKPENLLIDKKGRVKIADFGLAKLLRREPLDMTLTLSGMALGTLRYMAPEQMEKPESVDHRADLYSLGVVIYEMLTGETPVGRFELPSQKAQTDVRLDQIVLHALEREPARRYQHASEVRQDVEKVTSAPGPSAAAVTQIAPPAGIGAGDATPVQLSPLPRFFWLRSFGLLMLGWIAVGALWNLGVAGFLLGSAAMAAIVLEMGRTHANRNPRWVAKLRARNVLSRFGVLFMNLAVLTLVFIILLGGLFTRWDSAAMGGNYFSPTGAEYEARYKGKEYQLIRRLAAFQEQVPTVELVRDIGVYSQQRMGATFKAWWFTTWSLLLLLFFSQQSAGQEGRSMWSIRRGGVRSGLACTGVLLGSMLLAYAALCVWSLVGSTGRPGRPSTTVNNTVVVQANLKQASDALHRWAAENGYESESTRWGLQTVPKGVQVARVEIFDAWKDSPFERWQMSASGLKRPFPHITAEIDGTDSPAQTEVMLYTGYLTDGGMVEIGSAKEKQWHAIVNSLSEAVAKAAAFDPSNYIQKPPVKRPDGRTEWLSICGVLAAMLFWAFVRAWSLRSASDSEASALARRPEPQMSAWFIASCAIGLAGCLCPCSVIDHSFFGFNLQSEVNFGGVYVANLQPDSPAGLAGVIGGDTIRSMGGRETHLGGQDEPQRIWKDTPIGADLEIKLDRNKLEAQGHPKEVVLHTTRSSDPVGISLYAGWQFIAGFSLLFFAGFAFLGQSFPRARRWVGIVATCLAVGLLTLVLIFEPAHPEKVLSREIAILGAPQTQDVGQKSAICAAALALLLGGILETRRVAGWGRGDGGNIEVPGNKSRGTLL